MTRISSFHLVQQVAWLTLLALPLCAQSTVRAETAVTYSPEYNVDKIYKSMRGPQEERQGYRLLESDKPELLWITGFRARAVSAENGREESQEFVCHNTLSFNYPERTHALNLGVLPKTHRASQRLFTISQGQQEVRFPAGFGIPLLSSEPLMLQSQLLNLNHQPRPLVVRHKSETFYEKDSELKRPMQPLFMFEIIGAVPLSDVPAHDEHTAHSSCLSASTATKSFNFTDYRGRNMTAHWLVPPGRHSYENYYGRLGISYDTKAHYFLVHLHPFAESLELRDMTSGEVVFRSQVSNYPDKKGLLRVSHLASKEGIKIYHDHDYRMTSVYNNSSSEPQDAMSMLFIYALDKEFRRNGS